jgi:nucleoside 2-deoxyribosyltransferase
MKIFYIAPHKFDSEFSTKFQLLETIARKYDIQIFKGIKTGEQQFDLNKTMDLFNETDYFIADLSFERPSCYYEIGYAQANNKTIKLIALKDTEIHQVKGNVNFYSDIIDYARIIEKLIAEIKDEHTTMYKNNKG